MSTATNRCRHNLTFGLWATDRARRRRLRILYRSLRDVGVSRLEARYVMMDAHINHRKAVA
jgi:uncharacterized protein YjiS (DUF1127 family)